MMLIWNTMIIIHLDWLSKEFRYIMVHVEKSFSKYFIDVKMRKKLCVYGTLNYNKICYRINVK